MWPVLKFDEQRELVKTFADNYNFHGRVVSGNTSTGYNVEFDLLPAGYKCVAVSRKQLDVFVPGKEES